VLGARRRQVILAYLMEYAVLGLVTGALAAVVGSIAAYVVITELMGAAWIWLPWAAARIVLLSIAVTVLLGLAGTWMALSVRPAPLLRND
jgi:putative ABC transport system permease protein